jgi:hypothetical protein
MRVRPYLSVILLTSIIPCLAFAQGEPLSSLERGAKIRLTAATVPESERIGRLDSISPDSIQFRPDSHPVTRSLALKSVRTLEVSRGTRTRRSEYAMWGAIVGGVVGYIASNHNGQGLGTGKTDASQNALVGGIAGVALGGGLGWWYGGKKKVEAWHPVDR